MLASLLWVIVAALVVLWLLGFGFFHISSGLIFLLLVLAVIVAIVNLVSGGMWGGTRHVHTVAPTRERVVERREVIDDPEV